VERLLPTSQLKGVSDDDVRSRRKDNSGSRGKPVPEDPVLDGVEEGFRRQEGPEPETAEAKGCRQAGP